MSRPSTFTEATFAEIIERVSNGEPLARVCKDAHMPGLSTVYDWLQKSEVHSGRFARARESGFDMIAAECLQIVDDGANNPMHARVRAETRLKLLAKWDPKRYGEAVQVKHAGNEGQGLRDISESEAAARVASILEAVRRRALPPALDGSHSPAESNLDASSLGD